MIKRLLLLIIVGFLAAVIYADVKTVSEFGGLNTDDNPLFLKNKTPDSEDVETDNGTGLEPRNGFISFSTEPSRNLFSFYVSNGDKYLITQSSGQIKATVGGGSFSVFVSTVSPDVVTYVTGLGDKLFFCNTVDGLKYWDLSTVTTVGTYRPKFIATHKSRVWMAGVAGDERTIYGSEFLDGTNFTLAINPVDTDPVRISVQGALDDVLTGLYATFDDNLMWYKQRSFGAILGSRRSNFQSREYSDTVGCSYPDSITNCNGYLRWLGNDRVIYEFDGEKYYPINEDIDSYMDLLEQGDLNLRQWSQSTAADWNSGTIGVGLDTTTVQGDIGFFSGVTQSSSVFLATGSIRSGGSSDSMYVNFTTAAKGAYAVMFVPNNSLELDKVRMSFHYKSLVAEGFQSWVTLHSGATGPAPVIIDTSTNRVSENTNTSGMLTEITTNYLFSPGNTVDKRLSAGNTYWFVLHTTVTSPNLTPTVTYYAASFSNDASGELPLRAVSSITVFLAGASLEASEGVVYGTGSIVMSSVPVTPYSSIYLYAGRTSGPNNSADIRIGANDLASRVLVAGGGGAYGIRQVDSKPVWGGSGGFPSGTSGSDSNTVFNATGGGGGTSSSGGAGGTGTVASGESGGFGVAGRRGSSVAFWGGGGWYGGGGGGYSGTGSSGGTGAGGGGSSYSSYGGTVFIDSVWRKPSVSSVTYIDHAEFFIPEIESPTLSSTTLVFTSSFTSAGATYQARSRTAPFEVFLSTFIVRSTFTTEIFDAGTKFTEWNAVGINDETSGEGSIVYRIFVSSVQDFNIYDPSTFIASQTVVNGQVPSITTERYIAISCDFYRGNFSTGTAILHNLSVNFSEGSSIRTFGKFIDNRYWLSVAVSSQVNNKVLVYDRNKEWQRYNMNISAIVNYSGTFYFGNESGIYQLEYGSNDNGSPINSYYKTKTYALDYPDNFKTFSSIFMTTENSNSILNTQYFINEYDGGIEMSTYSMNTQNGYQNFKLPFSAEALQQGKYISVRWAISSAVPWRLLNANLYYSVDPEPMEGE